jgi:hypothetical protein
MTASPFQDPAAAKDKATAEPLVGFMRSPSERHGRGIQKNAATRLPAICESPQADGATSFTLGRLWPAGFAIDPGTSGACVTETYHVPKVANMSSVLLDTRPHLSTMTKLTGQSRKGRVEHHYGVSHWPSSILWGPIPIGL